MLYCGVVFHSVRFCKVSLLEMSSKHLLYFLFHVWSSFNDSPFIEFLEFFSTQPSPYSTQSAFFPSVFLFQGRLNDLQRKRRTLVTKVGDKLK